MFRGRTSRPRLLGLRPAGSSASLRPRFALPARHPQLNNEPPKGGAYPRKGFALSAAPQLLSHPLRGSTGKEIGIFCEPAFSDSLLFKVAVCFQFLYCVLFLFQKERPGGNPSGRNRYEYRYLSCFSSIAKNDYPIYHYSQRAAGSLEMAGLGQHDH